MALRSNKQCRERYLHHLCPRLSRRGWSAVEDFALFLGWKLLRNRWSRIAKWLPGRTGCHARNRFRVRVAKALPTFEGRLRRAKALWAADRAAFGRKFSAKVQTLLRQIFAGRRAVGEALDISGARPGAGGSRGSRGVPGLLKYWATLLDSFRPPSGAGAAREAPDPRRVLAPSFRVASAREADECLAVLESDLLTWRELRSLQAKVARAHAAVVGSRGAEERAEARKAPACGRKAVGGKRGREKPLRSPLQSRAREPQLPTGSCGRSQQPAPSEAPSQGESPRLNARTRGLGSVAEGSLFETGSWLGDSAELAPEGRWARGGAVPAEKGGSPRGAFGGAGEIFWFHE